MKFLLMITVLFLVGCDKCGTETEEVILTEVLSCTNNSEDRRAVCRADTNKGYRVNVSAPAVEGDTREIYLRDVCRDEDTGEITCDRTWKRFIHTEY